MIFALSLVPVAIAAGTGVDFSRALLVRSRLAEALDTAGLAVGAANGLTQAQMQQLAQDYFNANYTADASFGTPAMLTVTPENQSVTLSTSVDMPTTLMNVAGIGTLPVSYSAQIVWGQTKLWVSLVLDNTGSMSETDSIGTSKMSALKTASHQLLTMLQNAAANPGDIKVSIVPFNKDVNVGVGNVNAPWIDWRQWNTVNGRNACGFGDGHGGDQGNGFGRFDQDDHQDNGRGCTNESHNTWNGCIMDRDQSYDAQNDTPDPADTATLFPAEQYQNCPVSLMGLSYDWTALSDKVDSMYATGSTNQTIGFVWGWQTMTDGDPMNSGPLPAETRRVIILLSDGLNTQDRWYGFGFSHSTQVDAREELACDNAKAADVTIYTVFVDLNGTSGNSAALQYCASDSSKYFDLTMSGEIVTAFNTIGQQITNLRVAR